MTDETYTLLQTNKDRATAARSARARVNGSKSKRCPLGTDHMTPAQLRKRNGVIYQMNTSKPMTMQELKALPDHMTREYLGTIIQQHKPTTAEIADMLGCSGTYALQYLQQHGVSLIHKRGSRTEHRALWQRFIEGQCETLPQPQSTTENVTEPQKEEPALTGGSLRLRGRPADVLMKVLSLMADLDGDYTMTIEWEVTI